MDGGAGEDNLSGSDGDDTYLFQRGNQVDWVRYGTHDGTDTLRLGPGIALSDLEFVLGTNMFTGLSLSIRIKGTDDVLNIYTALGNTEASVTSSGEIDRVEFADGSFMLADDFYAHVVANAIQTGEPDQSRVGTAASEVMIGGDNGEFIYGMGGDDTITGGSAGDNIRAGLGDDVVHGGAGDDMLRGGEGADQLHGGIGDDTLIGGFGDDSFHFNAGDGHDTIMDAWPYGSPYDDLDGSGFDRLYLGEGLTPADVVVTRNGEIGLTLHFAGRLMTSSPWIISSLSERSVAAQSKKLFSPMGPLGRRRICLQGWTQHLPSTARLRPPRHWPGASSATHFPPIYSVTMDR
ncbi:hypothetical protein AR274_20485 [Stenotrophomonas maltophilia]|nr:hypothetical protein AR274_20485 [Stenotrophomonas maltophilia]